LRVVSLHFCGWHTGCVHVWPVPVMVTTCV